MYRAREETFDRTVAVKVLNSRMADAEALSRFERECRALGQVDGHPNIVTVHSAGTTVSGQPYLIMAYEPNGSLQDRLDRGLRPEPQQLAKIGGELADALATAHAADVLHRDVKPSNVLLSSREVPKLADFGIARLVGDTSRTKSGSITASIAHAPPEQIEGRAAGPASDAYSLGSTLAALALGHPPFMTSGNDSLASVLGRMVTQDPPDLQDVGQSEEMATLVAELMQKEPGARPADLSAVAARLRHMAERTDAPYATDAQVNFAPIPPDLRGYPRTTAGALPPPGAIASSAGQPPAGGYGPPPGARAVGAASGGRPASAARTGLLIGGVVGALVLLVIGGFALNALRQQPVDIQADVAVSRPSSSPTAAPTPTDAPGEQLQPLTPADPRPTQSERPPARPADGTPEPTSTAPDDAPTSSPETPADGSSLLSDAGLLSTTLVGENDLPGEDWSLASSAEAASPDDPAHPVALWDVCDQRLDPSQYGAAATNTFVQAGDGAGDPALPVASTVVEILTEPATVAEDILAHHEACGSYADSQADGSEVTVDIFSAEPLDFGTFDGVIALQTLPELGITYFSSYVITEETVVAIEADQRLGVAEITELVAVVQLNLTTLADGPGQ